MASLRDTVKDYQEELRDGIAWVAFWKTGRSWNAEYFHLEMGDILYPEDRSRMEEIKQADPAAVVVNGYYSGYLGEDMSLDELTVGVRRHYENGYSNIGEFIEAHDDRLPPELIEEARDAAHAAGLPFSEKAYRDGEEPDPYLFDGSMSMEDYELMHRMIENERSERMEETILSGYLSNLGKYTEGRPAGEWVSFPTTAEHLKEVFDRIGIDGKNYGELHISEYQSSIAGLAGRLTELESLDELNYLSELLKMQFDDDREKFVAAMAYGDHTRDLQDIINLAQNLDCYWIYPSVQSEEDYGHYLIEELDELELPEEAKKYFMYEEYGRDAAINDGGKFTEQGYIYNNRNTFTEWYDGRDVPEEYRVTPQFPKPEKETARENPPLIVVRFEDNMTEDERLKKLNKQLETGISKLFSQGRYTEYLQAMATFHTYSANNALLIALQKPGASFVAGYSTWEREYGRYATEKSIKILAPKPFTTIKRVKKIDPQTKQPVIDIDGKPIMEEKEIVVPKYKIVSVYDVSQTKGRELPALTEQEQADTERTYPDLLDAVKKASPYPIAFASLTDCTGICDEQAKRIIIQEGMDEQQSIQATIHEVAYAKLNTLMESDPKLLRPTEKMKKLQAESVAFAVCHYCGLDTSSYSFEAVKQLNSKELSELRTSFATIHKATKEILFQIDNYFFELQQVQGRKQTTEQAQPAQEVAKQPEAEATAPELPEETAPVQEKEAQTEQAAPAAPYYTINEAAAKRAKDANSFSDYKQGSATAEYRHYVDEAVQLAERQKRRVDPMYHEKIDSLLDTYARKLAANMNKGYEIDARVPSILIAGGSNFPTRKKEKQNAARDSNYREWQDIQGLLDKIRSTGMGGISADDPQAVQKLEKKLESLEKSQETMKAVNAYYRKHKTLDGCPHLSPEQLEKLKADMASSWHLGDKPFATWALSNNSAEIRRVKDRIKSLSQQKEIGFVGWEFDGGKVDANTEANRLQIFFEDKPDETTREALKSNGFRWSPKAGAWQRQLTSNAYYAADYVKSIQPLTGEKPTELQRAHIQAQKVAAQEQPVQEQPEQKAPQDKDTFSIYQIKGGDETRDLRFEPYDRLTATGHRVDQKNYSLVYSAELTPGTSLEDIYTRFNIDHPKDFKGHSLSVSDVVVLHQNGQDTAHYVDSFGYKEVPEFFKTQEKALIPDDLETGETVKTPRGTFYVTAMSREQMETAGYGLHHQSDDGKYLIMGNGTRAFAVPVQPENYLKAAEQTTEQNYNMIDGQINNTPTVAELEAKVKAGETISLVNLAEAVKADKERGKAAKTEKKPSIRAQLRADKEKTAQKKAAKSKNHELEV